MCFSSNTVYWWLDQYIDLKPQNYFDNQSYLNNYFNNIDEFEYHDNKYDLNNINILKRLLIYDQQ